MEDHPVGMVQIERTFIMGLVNQTAHAYQPQVDRFITLTFLRGRKVILFTSQRE